MCFRSPGAPSENHCRLLLETLADPTACRFGMSYSLIMPPWTAVIARGPAAARARRASCTEKLRMFRLHAGQCSRDFGEVPAHRSGRGIRVAGVGCRDDSPVLVD